MGNSTNHGIDHEVGSAPRDVTDWVALLRLALVCSVFAALAAIALDEHLADTTIVVCVIVAATMASWFQIEHPRPAARRVPIRRD